MKTGIFLTLVLYASLLSKGVLAQIEFAGIPASFQFAETKLLFQDVVSSGLPDMEKIRHEDSIASINDLAYRIGICIPVEFNLHNSGSITRFPDGTISWRLSIKLPEAQAVGLSFSEINLPEQAKLFLYSPDKQVIFGAFTSQNDFKNGFAIRPLPGEYCIIELNVLESNFYEAKMEITDLIFIYRNFYDPISNPEKSEQSGICEVNVSCSEGDNWQKQKSSVVKLLTKIGSSVFYCTGSVVNNTSQDFSPYVLSAAHCAEGFGGLQATESDYAKWIFYFNYESVSCNSNAVSGQPPTMVGAEKLAKSNNPSDMGSDFLLLKLKSTIPSGYKVFYSGWDASGTISQSGVCIHHPDGDVKKISTYTLPLTSGTWESTPNTHWIVKWADTPNGYGVTEGGSSGSPLFNNNGLIVGTLTGGYSDCNDVTQPDYYGKMSYSWVSNGLSPEQQLKPWLDPANLGTKLMAGAFNDKFTSAGFVAVNNVAPIGSYIVFNDLSTGNPSSWHWYFENGEPAESLEKNPPFIFYKSYGNYDVKLVVSNEFNTDSIIHKDFVSIRAVVSPNPTPDGIVNILTNTGDLNPIQIKVYDYLGKIYATYNIDNPVLSSYTIQLPETANLFYIHVNQGDYNQTHKVIRLKR